MKNYYAEASVKFTGLDDDNKPYNDEENYSFIIESNNKKQALKDAKIRAMEEFDNDLNDNCFENITIEIDVLYQTTEDARV